MKKITLAKFLVGFAGLLLFAFTMNRIFRPSACECIDMMAKSSTLRVPEGCATRYGRPMGLNRMWEDCTQEKSSLNSQNQLKQQYNERKLAEKRTDSLCASLNTNILEFESNFTAPETLADCILKQLLESRDDANLVFKGCDKLKYLVFSVSSDDRISNTRRFLLYKQDYFDLLDEFKDIEALKKGYEEQQISFRDYEDQGVSYKVMRLESKN